MKKNRKIIKTSNDPGGHSEIRLILNFTNSKKKILDTKYVTYESDATNLKYKKSVKIKKNDRIQTYSFHIVGMKYQIKSKKILKKILNEINSDQKLTVKHEYKNKQDNFACAVYYKKTKLGYVPQTLNQQILDLANHGRLITFVVSKPMLYHEFEDSVLGLNVMAICY